MKFLKVVMVTLFAFLAINLSANETIEIDTIKGKVVIPKNPKRVVILDYAVLDTMDALGVKGVKLGLSLGFLPKTLEKYKAKGFNIGDIKEPDIEKVYTFKPDVIFMNGRQDTAYNELKTIAPVIYINLDNKRYIDSSKKSAKKIAKIFGKEDQLDKKFEKIDKKVAQIKSLASKDKKKTLIILTNNGKVSAYGPGSRFGYIYTDLNLNPVDKHIKISRHGQGINYEYISKMNPDVLLFIDRTVIIGEKKLGADTLNNELVNNTKAGKNHKIIALSPQKWYLEPGGLNTISYQLNEIKKAIK